MSKCRDLDPLFAPYADGDGAPGDRASVEAHLERCPPCRDRVAASSTVRAVVAARRPTLRTGASERAPCPMRRACADASPTACIGRDSPRIAATWVPLSLAATLVIAVAGAFIIGLNDNVEALAAQLTHRSRQVLSVRARASEAYRCCRGGARLGRETGMDDRDSRQLVERRPRAARRPPLHDEQRSAWRT